MQRAEALPREWVAPATVDLALTDAPPCFVGPRCPALSAAEKEVVAAATAAWARSQKGGWEEWLRDRRGAALPQAPTGPPPPPPPIPRPCRRTRQTLPYWQQRLRWAAQNAPSPECRAYFAQAARGFRGLQQAASLVGWQPWPLLAQLLVRVARAGGASAAGNEGDHGPAGESNFLLYCGTLGFWLGSLA